MGKCLLARNGTHTNVADKPGAFIVKAEVKILLKLCTYPPNYNA
jgi:hypothetical protein